MREIITRFGRHNIGFLWLFAEPMVFTLGVAALWTASKSLHGNQLPIVGFAITGYSSVLLWRNCANRCAKAIEANTALLFHRNVKVIDIMLARIILEIAGATISFIVLSAIFISVGLMAMPVDISTMLVAWFLTAWLATALALNVGVLSELSEVFDRLWHAFTYLLFPLSGAAFLVDWLPEQARTFVLYVPMVHGTEMLRHGYYGDIITTYENPSYLIICSMVLTLIGLVGIRYLSTRITPE